MKKIRRQKIQWRNPYLLGTKPIEVIQDRNRTSIPTRYKVAVVPILLAICLFITLVLGQSLGPVRTLYNKIADPVRQLYLTVDNFVADTITSAKRIRSLEEENESLSEQLEYYVYENTILTTEVAQAEELLELYELDQYYEDYEKTAAQIVGISNNNWYDTIIINKGTSDGLTTDMPVLADGALLGRITTVYENYALVTTLVDPDSNIFGEVNRLDHDTVNIQGSEELFSEVLCKIQYDPDETDLVVGDEIITSALGEIYPPGLLIGTITSIEENADGLTNTAYLEPASDPEGLNYVLIITELWKENMDEELSAEDGE